MSGAIEKLLDRLPKVRAALSTPAPAGAFVSLVKLKQIDMAIHYAPPSEAICEYVRAAIRDAEVKT